MNDLADYVLFAKKGNYRFSIRTPSLSFGGARMHIDTEDGSPIYAPDSIKIINLKTVAPSTSSVGSYITLIYDSYAITKHNVQTAFLNRKDIAFYPEILENNFSRFLKYLESQNVAVNYEVGLTVYMDTIIDVLTASNFYPPKGDKPVSIEQLTASVGGLIIK